MFSCSTKNTIADLVDIPVSKPLNFAKSAAPACYFAVPEIKKSSALSIAKADFLLQENNYIIGNSQYASASLKFVNSFLNYRTLKIPLYILFKRLKYDIG